MSLVRTHMASLSIDLALDLFRQHCVQGTSNARQFKKVLAVQVDRVEKRINRSFAKSCGILKQLELPLVAFLWSRRHPKPPYGKHLPLCSNDIAGPQLTQGTYHPCRRCHQPSYYCKVMQKYSNLKASTAPHDTVQRVHIEYNFETLQLRRVSRLACPEGFDVP